MSIFDVFISYRRENGGDLARLVRAELARHGVRVFLDLDDLGSGHFDEKLLDTIGATPAFVVILSKGSLARCRDPEDWVRREILHAIATRRLIVPILGEGFDFASDALPEELAALRRYNGLKYSLEYFDRLITRLLEYLDLTPVHAVQQASAANDAGRSPDFVFLDFDGVLRPVGESPNSFNRGCVRAFEDFMRKHPNARIVITSSWRLGMSQRELARPFSPDIQARIVGVTPKAAAAQGPARHAEILAYLRENDCEDARWIAIDDDAGRYATARDNVIVTDPRIGFDTAAAQRFGALIASKK